MEERRLIADVAVENTLFAFDKLFGYSIPAELEGSVKAGVRVVVPFGKGNKKRMGLVFAVHDDDGSVKCKAISAAADSEPVLSRELLDLCAWIKENTFCTYFDAFRAIFPPGLGYTLKVHYSLSADNTAELTEEERRFTEILRTAADRASFDAVVLSDKTSGGGRLVKSLLEKGVLREDDVLRRRVGDETVSMLRLSGDIPESAALTRKQREVVDFIGGSECASLREACYACTVTP